MDVGDDRHPGLGDDRRKRLRVGLVGDGHPDDVRPLGGEGVDLDQGGGDVLGLGRGHRLDRDGRTVADVDGAEADAPGGVAWSDEAGLSAQSDR